MIRILLSLILSSIMLLGCAGIEKSTRFDTAITNIVVDNSTGLMWTVADNGSDISWDAANSYCAKLKAGGFSDWRLPSKNEIKGILNLWSRKELKTHKYFTITGKYLWLSDVNGSYAGYFHFNDGHELYTPMHGGSKARVLAVRYIKQPVNID